MTRVLVEAPERAPSKTDANRSRSLEA